MDARRCVLAVQATVTRCYNADAMESQTRPAISIIVAEPFSIVRAGLQALLESEPGFVVIGQAADDEGLLSHVRSLRPDVVLLVATLPGNTTTRLLSKVKLLHPSLKVVILANPQDEETVRALLGANVDGCFLKSDRPEELLRGIRAVIAGELALSSTVMRWLLKQPQHRGVHSPSDPLTEREREVLDLLFAGLSNKEIAQKLYLSVRTVEVHLRNIYGKLGVRSRLEAVTQNSSFDRQDAADGRE